MPEEVETAMEKDGPVPQATFEGVTEIVPGDVPAVT
jgi:hypothetical protein